MQKLMSGEDVQSLVCTMQGSSNRSFKAGWERRGVCCRADVQQLMVGDDVHYADVMQPICPSVSKRKK